MLLTLLQSQEGYVPPVVVVPPTTGVAHEGCSSVSGVQKEGCSSVSGVSAEQANGFSTPAVDLLTASKAVSGEGSQTSVYGVGGSC